MFKLTIQGPGMNFDIEVNQEVVGNIVRQAITNKFGPSAPVMMMRPPVVSQAIMPTVEHEPEQVNDVQEPEDGEPP